MISIEDCVELTIGGLEVYVHGSVERFSVGLGFRMNGDLKRYIESLIVAAQNQSIRTNLGKAKPGRLFM